MVKFMKKIPAGNLLVPMFISALINTLWPNLFDIGGFTEALFGGSGVTFIVALLTFISATLLDVAMIKDIMKKQGLLILLKLVIAFGVGFLLINNVGTGTVLGVSALVVVVALTSTNPAMYLALVNDYGTKTDAGAFGLLGIVSTPVIPVLIFAASLGGEVDWLSLFSTILPIVLGLLLGNLDPDFRDLTQPALGILMPFLGWGLGASMNLLEALRGGLGGIIVVVIYLLLILIPLYLFETRVLKSPGGSAVGMSSLAGVSLAAPAAVAQLYPQFAEFVPNAVAQLSFGVVITSILIPILVREIVKRSDQKIFEK